MPCKGCNDHFCPCQDDGEVDESSSPPLFMLAFPMFLATVCVIGAIAAALT